MGRVILYTVLIFVSLSGYSQNIEQVSLENLKLELIKNNIDLQLSAQKIALSKEDQRLSNKNMVPTVQLSGVLSSTNVPLHAFGTRLQQSRITQADFNPLLLNNPDHIQNFQASINVMQPILNLDTYNFKKASKYAVDARISGHKREEEYRLYLLEGEYLQLQHLYSVKEELQSIRSRAEEIVGIAGNAVDVGYAYQDDILKAEVRLSEISDKILETDLYILSISDNINYLCGRDYDTTLEPALPLETDINIDVIPELNLNRFDFQAMQHGINAKTELINAKKNGKKPRINAMLSYEANLYDVVDGGNGYWAGLQMTWQLFDGSKSSVQIQKSKINQIESTLALKKSQSESVKQLNLLNNQVSLLTAQISTSKDAINQAEETFRISVNRFTEGIEKASDMIRKEIELSEKMLELQQLYLQYQLNLKAIEFTAG